MTIYNGNNVLDTLLTNKITDGAHRFLLGGSTYLNSNADVIKVKNYYTDTTISNSVDVSSLFNDITTDDTFTAVRIFHGNLTIAASVTVIPPNRVKGLFVLVKGTLTFNSNSKISMTAEGASGSGQAFVLCQKNGVDQSIAASGANGASGVSGSADGTLKQSNGTAPSAATGRQTGGGASGALHINLGAGAGSATSGSGSAGTSWAGGSGGGGMIQRRIDSPTVTGSAGTAGGAGGNGTAYTLNLSVTRYAGGGAGFGGGLGRQSLASGATGNQSNNATYDGGTGAGGLLVVWVRRNIVNASGNTAFESRGSQGGGAVPSGSELSAGGGSSGSGSVNVFYEYAVTNLTTTNLDVSGIAAKTSTATGGTGGAGSKNLELLNTSKPRLTLFLVGTSYKKYVPSSATAGTWTTVGSTSDSNATKETMFQTHGMFDEDIKLYVTKAILADSGAYGANPSDITIRTYVPS